MRLDNVIALYHVILSIKHYQLSLANITRELFGDGEFEEVSKKQFIYRAEKVLAIG